MLKHDFGIVGEKKEFFLEDNLILYMIDSFEWIKTLSELENNKEKYIHYNCNFNISITYNLNIRNF